VFPFCCRELSRGEIERDIGVAGLENCTLRFLGIIVEGDRGLVCEALCGRVEEGSWLGGDEEAAMMR